MCRDILTLVSEVGGPSFKKCMWSDFLLIKCAYAINISCCVGYMSKKLARIDCSMFFSMWENMAHPQMLFRRLQSVIRSTNAINNARTNKVAFSFYSFFLKLPALYWNTSFTTTSNNSGLKLSIHAHIKLPNPTMTLR